MSTQYSDMYPVCPHCLKLIEGYGDGRGFRDGEVREDEECPHCEKKFRCEVFAIPSFTTKKVDDDGL